ncbi:single-stranded DNA-binding protein 1-A, mitochondrial isoform X2 [Hydra vulgaris]|uniref:Single-stranded DNA-binding protein 1-A, mitochondrial isoform X2 n=1 Tax=Hydra vulgaris TaxID=6087 RepID=A0ABM4D232_HYDVU
MNLAPKMLQPYKFSSILTITKKCFSDYTGPMEKSLNMVQLLGRVGQKPVIRGEKDKKFATFGLATNINYSKKTINGPAAMMTKTEWHDITVFRPFLVDRVEQYVDKGSRVMIMGSIEYVNYEKADGTKVQSTRIVPDDLIILSGKGAAEIHSESETLKSAKEIHQM